MCESKVVHWFTSLRKALPIGIKHSSNHGHDYNVGVGILKILAAFLVVGSHFEFLPVRIDDNFCLNTLAVPFFTLISFWLSYKAVMVEGCIKRLIRFGSLFFVWGVLFIVKAWYYGQTITVSSIAKQLVFGVGYCSQLYYLFNVMVCILILRLALFTSRKILSIALVGLLALVLQYSNLNWRIVVHCFGLEDHVPYSVGRIFELLPLACCGLLIREVDKLVNERWRLLLSTICGLAGFGLYFLFDNPKGFGYQGLPLIMMSTAVFVIFKEIRLNQHLYGLVKTCSSLMTGVYVLHVYVGCYIMERFSIETGFLLTTLSFIGSFIVSYIISRIRPINWLVV